MDLGILLCNYANITVARLACDCLDKHHELTHCQLTLLCWQSHQTVTLIEKNWNFINLTIWTVSGFELCSGSVSIETQPCSVLGSRTLWFTLRPLRPKTPGIFWKDYSWVKGSFGNAYILRFYINGISENGVVHAEKIW